MSLPSAALAVMLGVVFVVNMHRYGWVGAVGGIALIAGGVALGIRSFCDAGRARHSDAA